MKRFNEKRHVSGVMSLLFAASSLAHADLNPHAISDPLAAEAATLTSGFFPITPNNLALTDPTGQGAWGPVIEWTPHIPVTAATLPDGRLLTFSSNERTTFPFGPEFTYSAVWDPATGVFTDNLNNVNHDMFCAGTSMLPDGRVFISGGRNATVLGSIFDYRTNQWDAVQNMADGRWYNTNTVLPDGTVLTVGGSGGLSGNGSAVATAELWNAATGWRRLTGITWGNVLGEAGYSNQWHPFVMLAPNGKLFHFGPTDQMHWITTNGSGSLNPSGQTIPGTQYPKEGAWAMYDEGRILVSGGGATTEPNSLDPTTGSTSSNAAYTIELNGATPVVSSAASMANTRQLANSVILPSGEVMVIGGNTTGIKYSDVGSVLTPELWNPRTGTWRPLADMSVPRNYHSVALLLPDGRVWSGGGGLSSTVATNHQDAQIFTPPALYAGNGSLATRPVITEAPALIGPSNTFTVRATPGLAKFSFIRMSAVTHAVNTDLRYISVPFTETEPGVYSLTAHDSSNVLVPGYWMLFALDSASVHSVSKIIQVSHSSALSVTNPGDQLPIQGVPVHLPVSVSVLPSTTLAFSATGLPDGLSIHPETGVISGTTYAPAGSYWCSVMVTPNVGGAVTVSFNWNVLLPNLGTGSIFSETWYNIPGSTVNTLTSHYLYPERPDERDFLFTFEAPSEYGNYTGRRIRGYFHPPATASYQFAIASDDQSELYLSSDANPANAVLIANNPSLSLPREWTRHESQLSQGIPLQAGQRYYIEAIMKEDNDTDNLAVGFKQFESPDPFQVIPGQYLSPFDPVKSFAAAYYFEETAWNGTAGEVKNSSLMTPGLHGTSIGGATTTSSPAALAGNPGTGRLASFNGTSQCVSIPYSPALNPNDFTLTAWVRPNATPSGWRSVITSREPIGGNFRGYGLYFTPDNKWMFLTGTSWTALNGPNIVPGQWVHVSASFRTVFSSGGTRTGIRRIFLNGLPVAEDWATYVPPASGTLYIGAASGGGGPGDFVSGEIDDVRIYQASLGTADLPKVAALRRPLNSSPNITNPGNLASGRNSSISQPIIASDQDGDTITFGATGLPTGLTISSGSGIVSGSPTTNGEYNVVITATDTNSQASSAAFVWSIVDNLTVSPVASPPLAAAGGKNFTASSTGGKNPVFQWNFGDGSPDTAFSSSPAATHTFPGPGRYLVTVTATDDTGRIVTGSYYQALHPPLTANAPAHSTPIAYETRVTLGDRIWVVNPDNDSVSVLNSSTGARVAEINVGDSPRTVAIAPDGRVWVSNADADSLSVIDPVTLAVTQTVPLQRGSRPFGIAFSPVGGDLYVALENAGKLLKLHPVTGAELASLTVGPNVRHLSIPANGTRILLSRFITPRLTGEETATITTTGQGGEVLAIDTASFTLAQTILLHHSEDTDSSTSSRGIPNYLGAPTVSPDGLSAWVPSKKDNIKRGILRDNRPLTHDMSVRSIVSRINLATQAEDLSSRVDMDNSGMPSAVVYDPWGIFAFVTLEANRAVSVIDVWNHSEIMRFDVGRAPQGLAISPDGRKLFVHNFMDRTVSIHQVGSLIDGLGSPPPGPAITSTITTESLAPQILVGKQHFYDARDSRLAFQEYVSCASCHNDGGQDGRVWDFTGFGEGLRNTISLRGHGGASQGPLHWTGNFDEVQDFENQIRNFSGGAGLIASGTPHPPLGTPNAGRSADLDALAAYVSSLTTQDPSPHRDSAGNLTPAAAAGELVFRARNCASCHGGEEFTHSAPDFLPNIGTLKPSSGTRLGGALTGIDVPTLRGAWATPPYLHDGSAATLEQAVTAHQGVSLGATDLSNLVAYIKSIDGQPAAAPLPKTQFPGWAEVTPGATGDPTSNADGDLAADLLEYALDGSPLSGASPPADSLSLEEVAGAFHLTVRRPVGLTDVTYEAMTSPDLVSWTPYAVTNVHALGNGMEAARFENLQSRPGLTTNNGFVRLRVTRNGISQFTLPLGWSGIELGQDSRTLGIPYREPAVFSSSVTGVSGNQVFVHGTPNLPPLFRGFLEITTGAYAGNRFEYSAAAPGVISVLTTAASTLAAVPDLTGSQVILSAHHTVGEVLPKSVFKGSTDPSAADQLQFYINNGGTGHFELYYLLDSRPGSSVHQWRAFLPSGGDQATRIVAPGEGILLKRPLAAPSSRLVLRGQVRANSFIQPLRAGLNLTGAPFPVTSSPFTRGLLDPLSAFVPAQSIPLADQFLLYQTEGFHLFYFLDHPTFADQWHEDVVNSYDLNNVMIFDFTKAIFFKRANPAPGYRIPPLWTP